MDVVDIDWLFDLRYSFLCKIYRRIHDVSAK